MCKCIEKIEVELSTGIGYKVELVQVTRFNDDGKPITGVGFVARYVNSNKKTIEELFPMGPYCCFCGELINKDLLENQ
jgi:hypothetical protein